MKRSNEPAHFDEYAADYATLLRDPIREKFADSSQFFFERKIQVIRRFYKSLGIDTRAQRWLDVGCGQGDLLRLGKADFGSTSGCDVSGGMLQSCSDLNVRIQPSPEEIPYDDNSFDFVTAVCVYHHVPEERRPFFTARILRVLKRAGIFCIIEHNPLNPATQLIVSRTPVDADAHLLRAKAAENLMTSAGATVVDKRYFLWFPQQIYKHAAAIENRLSKVPLGGQYAVFARKEGMPEGGLEPPT